MYNLTAVTSKSRLYTKTPYLNEDKKPDDSCTDMFVIDFVTPPIDVNLTIKGHLRAGYMLFQENPQTIFMKHITPLPHEINYTCSGMLSGTFTVLRHETIVCLINSNYELLKEDLYFGNDFQIFKTNNDIKLKNFVIKALEHTNGKRHLSFKQYKVWFELEVDENCLQTRILRLDLMLHDKTMVLPKTPANTDESDGLQLLLISCPRDGRMYCNFWKWQQIANNDWSLKLLPSRKHQVNGHPYGTDWETITIDNTMEFVDSISQLNLDHNEFKFLPNQRFQHLTNLVCYVFFYFVHPK